MPYIDFRGRLWDDKQSSTNRARFRQERGAAAHPSTFMKVASLASEFHRAFVSRGTCYALTLHPHFENRFGRERQRAHFREHARWLCVSIGKSFCRLSRKASAKWSNALPELLLFAEEHSRSGEEVGYHAHGVVIFRPDHGLDPEPRFRALLRRDWGEDSNPGADAYFEDLLERYPFPSLDALKWSRSAKCWHRPSFDLQPINDGGWTDYSLKVATDDYELITTKDLMGA